MIISVVLFKTKTFYMVSKKDSPFSVSIYTHNLNGSTIHFSNCEISHVIVWRFYTCLYVFVILFKTKENHLVKVEESYFNFAYNNFIVFYNSLC